MLDMLKASGAARRYFLAHLQSELGSGAGYVALVLIAYQRLHSGWAIALVLLADFLPGIALSAPFGALADRVSRVRLAVGADLLRAGAFLGLTLISSFSATVALALLAGVGTALFRPAVNAALPELVTEEQRSPATALYGACFSIGMTVGPALTALFLLFGSPELLLAANGVTFLVSAALLSGVPLGGPAAPVDDEAADDEAKAAPRSSVWSATREGARSAAQLPGVMPLLAIGAVSILAAGLMNVAEPLLATGPLAAGRTGYSLLVAVYGGGMVIGALVNARVGSEVSTLRRRLLAGVALDGLGMLGSALAPSLGFAIASFAVTGIANTLILGAELRLFHELVSDGLRGRVFGLRATLANAAFVVAFVSSGALIGLLGVRAVFALGGAALVALAATAALALRPWTVVEPALPAAAEAG